MELKVWVDGIQRVVCGATLDTTCQDVVVALAHAMGRTGRFTLIEKWRDIDRPLTPADCPLRVLHKWGEYAPQVKFLLCQADLDQKQQPSKEKTPAFVENRPFFTPKSPTLYGPASDVSVKRALTFSGVHGTSASHSSLQSNALAPTTKLRRTHLGPVPIGSDKHSSSLLHSSTHSSPRHPALLGKGSHEQHKEASPPKQAQRHPVAPPRKRLSPVLQQEQNARMVPHDSLDSLPLSSSSSSSTLQNSGNSRVQSSSSESSQQCQSSESNSPVNSFRQSHVHSSSGLQSQGVQHSHGYPPDLKQVEERLNQSSPSPPLLPSSLPPSVTGSDLSSCPKPLPLRPPDLMQDHNKSMIDIETSVTGRDHSHQASLEIEEYDLDSNFPDTYKDFGGNEWPAVTVEYRLEDGLGPGGSHVENEHAKLVRLVDMQQERMKTQESQIDLINTEITSLEEREREYEENLQDILVELLQLENVERDLEPELSRLENVEWDNVLDGEKKCEQDLKGQIADCQAQINVYQEKIEQLQQRERDLTEETEAEKVRIQHEEDILKAEEARAQEEADKLGIEVDSLQGQLQELHKTAGEREVVLRELDTAMKSAEIDLQERQCQLLELEQELKEENLKVLSSNPSKDDLQRQESGETILKILEGRLSPRLPAASGPMPDNATLPPFISALAPKNPSGVWV